MVGRTPKERVSFLLYTKKWLKRLPRSVKKSKGKRRYMFRVSRLVEKKKEEEEAYQKNEKLKIPSSNKRKSA